MKSNLADLNCNILGFLHAQRVKIKTNNDESYALKYISKDTQYL